MYEYEYNLWESTGVKKPSWELFAKSEKDKVSIEHILPQTPSKWYWRNQFRQFIQDEAEMAALTGSLGNLLPLAQSINSSLQNDSFDEKKNPTNSGRRGYSSGSNSEIEVAKRTHGTATVYILVVCTCFLLWKSVGFCVDTRSKGKTDIC